MSQIGSWINTGAFFVVAPNCAKLGNYNADFNSGIFATNPDSAGQPLDLNGFAVGKGYVESTGSLDFGGDGDNAQSTLDLSVDNATTFFVEAKVYLNAGTNQFICGQYDSDTNYWMCAHRGDGRLHFAFRKGATTNQVITTATFGTGFHNFGFSKEGIVIKCWSAGFEIKIYDVTGTYALGDIGITNKLIIGKRGSDFYLNSSIYWLCIYNLLPSDADILSNANLSNSMGGLFGIATGGNMEITDIDPSAVSARQNKSALSVGLNL